MNDELDQLLRSLHLKRIREVIADELAHAEREQLSYADFLLRLLRAQWHFRQESALAYRIKRAGMPEQWSLESFPFKRQPGVSRRTIRGFAGLDFIGQAHNIVFIGPRSEVITDHPGVVSNPLGPLATQQLLRHCGICM